MRILLLHNNSFYGIIVIRHKYMKGGLLMARPKSKLGVKVHTAFKIYQHDKDRLIDIANSMGMTVSSYVNQAVLEKVSRDEKSKDKTTLE